LENCDELFELSKEESLVLGKKETGSMILQPGFDTYLNLLTWINKQKGAIKTTGKSK
jgi:hypothetical protein